MDIDFFSYNLTGLIYLILSHSIKKRSDISKRIAIIFFCFIHKHHILFGDLNEGNFLYNEGTDTITFIDYGCIILLNETQMVHLKSLHRSQRSLSELRELMRKWDSNDNMADFVYQQSLPFWETDQKFSDVPGLYEFMKDPMNAMAKMPSELAMVIRASQQLVNLIMTLGGICSHSR